MTTDRDLGQLLDAARTASSRAYAPYSGYHVGAAVLTASGAVYTGCNVENATYGATLCAERVALAKMVSEGARDPVALAIFTSSEPLAMPCGICRQAMVELAEELTIVVGGPQSVERTTLSALLPAPFRFTRKT
jgi:cytidine deaminase